MKKAFRISVIVSLIMAILLFVETPVGAVSPLFTIVDDDGDVVSIGAVTEEETTDTIITEIESERTENTKTFLLKNGNSVIAEYDMPIHYQDTDGKWIDYDNSMDSAQKEIQEDNVAETPETVADESFNEDLDGNQTGEEDSAEELVSNDETEISQNEQELPSENEETIEQETEKTETESQQSTSTDDIKRIDVYSNKTSDKDISFAKQSDEQNMVMYSDDEYTISWGYKEINKRSAQYIQDNTKFEGNDSFLVLKNLESIVKYESAYKDVDIECITYPLGIKENIILKNKSSESRFVSQYRIGELIAKEEEEGYIALTDSNGDIKFYLTADYMIDAKGQLSNDVTLKVLSQENGILEVEMVADNEWLQADDREYPVKIDPTFLTGQDYQQVQCALIDSQYPDRCYAPGTYYGSPYANVGGYGSELYRTLMKINSLPTLNKGDMIVKATANLILYSNSFFTDSYIGLYEVSDGSNGSVNNWSQMSVTWNTQPSTSNILIDYQKVYEGMSADYLTWDITTLAKKWYNNGNNNGFCLKTATSSSNQQNVAFFSSNYPEITHIRPTFALTYRNNKGIEDYWSYTSFNVGTAGTLSVNKYSGALTFSTSINSTADPIMPASVGLVYNSYIADDYHMNSRTKVAKGWKMNIQQTVLQSSYYNPSGSGNMDRFPYVYADGDGTEHYFYQKGNDTSKYYDEDGLDLELTINSSSSNEHFIITDKDKNQLIFESWGYLNKIKDANGNTTKINYNAFGSNSGYRIQSVRDQTGNLIGVSLNNSFVGSITDPAGRTTTFTSSNEKLSTISRPDGTSVQFGYNNDGLLTSITDVDGYRVEISYDGSNRQKVTQIVEIDANNNVGNKITYTYPKINQTVIRSSGLDGVYDNSDDYITTYQFDNYGREVSAQTKTAGGEDLGASHQDYTSGEVNSSGSNVKTVNRISSDFAAGKNVINHLKNHGLESLGFWEQWTWEGSSVVFSGTCVSCERYFGQKSFCLNVASCPSTSGARLVQSVYSLSAGQTYTFSGYVKVGSMSGNADNSGALLAAEACDANGDVIDSFFSEMLSEPTDSNMNDGWRRISVTFTVPTGTNRVRACAGIKAAEGTAYFDGLQLEEGETAGSYNMVQNGSMEFDSLGWTRANLTSGDAYVTNAHQSGSRAYRIYGDVSSAKSLYQQINVSGSEEDTYILSGWASAYSVDILSDRKYCLHASVKYTDGTTKDLAEATFNSAVPEWQYTSKAFTLSDGNSSTHKTPASIYINLMYSYQGNNVCFDNISLVKEPAASYTYDSNGNLISVTANAEQNSSIQYNSNNQLTKITDPRGYSYEYTYTDSSKRIVKTAKTQLGAVYTYDYDSRGSTTKLEGEVDGLKIKSEQNIDYPEPTECTEYTVTTKDTRGYQSSSTYNSKTGTLTSSKDNRNVNTSYTYRADNDLMTKVTKLGRDVLYTYDSSYKHLTGVSSPTVDYSFEYNQFGEREKTYVGTQLLADYDYNSGGQMTQMTYGNGDYVTYSYDKYGNVAARDNYDSEDTSTASYRAYADNNGTVTRAQDLTNDLEYNSTYDSIGRLISSTVTDMSTNKFKSAYEYKFDQNNNVKRFVSLTPYGSNATSYTYIKDNLPKYAYFTGGRMLINNYDNLGRLIDTTVNTSTNIHTEYTYLDSNVSGYTTNFVETETNGDFSYKYEYDANGNITKIYRKDENNSYVPIEKYTYNAMGELLEAEYLETHLIYDYGYDPVGNIVYEDFYDADSETEPEYTIDYEYDDSNWADKLTSYNGTTITYDNIGNPLNYRDGMTFTWQNGRQLASYGVFNANTNQVDGIATYTYDSSGTRLKKVVNNVTYTYLYNGSQLLQETIGDQILDYSYDANGQIYAVCYRANANDEGTYYYYAHNTRGDIVGLYNADGTLHAKYTYDVWGNKLAVTNASGVAITSQTDIANIQPFRYRGYYYDYESGFYYLQSRYYDPVTHRFINADGLVSTGTGVLGYNMFAYCENNPVILSDENGHFGIINSIFCAVATIVTAVVTTVITVQTVVNRIKYGPITQQINNASKKYNSNTINFTVDKDGTSQSKLNVKFIPSQGQIEVKDSYKISNAYEKMAVINEIVNSEFYDPNVYSNSKSSMMKEWSGHNFVYKTAANSGFMMWFYKQRNYPDPLGSTQNVNFRNDLEPSQKRNYNLVTLWGILQW